MLDLATRPAASLGRPLDGEGVALVFEKPSNRTRHSMEMAVVQLGGHPMYTRGEEVGFDDASPSRMWPDHGGYHAMIAARVFHHDVLERMAAVADVPVVNMLSDHRHPLQALADALTMEQRLGARRQAGRVGRRLQQRRPLPRRGRVMLGTDVRFACPSGFEADAAELERLALLGAAPSRQSMWPAEAVGAPTRCTPTRGCRWARRTTSRRKQAFEGFTVDEDLMSVAADAGVHALPARRTGSGGDRRRDRRPAERRVPAGHNRMHAARGLLALLAGVPA